MAMGTHNQYWPVEGGTLVACIHPFDSAEASVLLQKLFPNKIGVFFFLDDVIWRGVDYVVTIDEEADTIARLIFDVPVVYLPKLIGRPLRSGGVPVVQPDGTMTTLTPMR